MRCVSSRSAPRSPLTTSTGQRIRDHSSHQPRPLASESAARSTSCSKLGHSPSSRSSRPPPTRATTTCRHRRRQGIVAGGEGHRPGLKPAAYGFPAPSGLPPGSLPPPRGLGPAPAAWREQESDQAAERLPHNHGGSQIELLDPQLDVGDEGVRRDARRCALASSVTSLLDRHDPEGLRQPGCGLEPSPAYRRARAAVQRPGRDPRDPGSTAESPRAPRRASARPPRREVLPWSQNERAVDSAR